MLSILRDACIGNARHARGPLPSSFRGPTSADIRRPPIAEMVIVVRIGLSYLYGLGLHEAFLRFGAARNGRILGRICKRYQYSETGDTGGWGGEDMSPS